MFVLTVFAALTVFNTKAQAVGTHPAISNASLHNASYCPNVEVNFDYALCGAYTAR